MKIRNDNAVSSVIAAQDSKLCIQGDQTERAKMTSVLYALYKARRSAVLVSMDSITLTLHEGSSFYYMHKPLSKKLSDLLSSFHPDAEAIVTHAGLDLWLNDGSPAETLQQKIQADPEAQSILKKIMQAAQLTGGAVRSVADEASYAQWLQFHGLIIPASVEQLEQLLNFLQWEFRDRERIDEYWQQINGHSGGSATLTEVQCQEIRALTAKFIPANKSLLTVLYENVKPVLHDVVGPENADDILNQITHHDFSFQLAKKYIDALGWWGSGADEVCSGDDYAQVLYTAILIQLDPLIAEKKRRNVIAGYDLYHPAVAADKKLHVIREEFERHLIRQGTVSQRLAPLASHMLLSCAAPGLLISNVPEWLTAGSIGWVTFSQAVGMIELSAKGASRFVDYEDVMLFADMGSISQALGELQSLSAIDVIIDWALINEVIAHHDLETSTTAAAQTALQAYQSHVGTMVNGVKAFSTPVPNRKKLAMAALKQVMPDCDFLEEPLLRPEPFSSLRQSMLDLHIQGELTSGVWDWNEKPHILSRYPQLMGLANNQTIFKADVRKYHGDIHRAIASNIKLALSGIPRQDRDIIARSKITFFTVRAPVTELVYPSSNYNLIGVANKGPTSVEVQSKKDQAIGRFAVIMIASYEGGILCYELFSLLGECRRNDALGELIIETQKMNMPSRLDFKGSPNDAVFPLPATHRVPTDFQSYTQGSRPRPDASDIMVIEKLGVIPAPVTAAQEKQSLYQFFMSEPINNIAQFVVTHRPVGSVEELTMAFTELTERESIVKKTEEWVTFTIDLLVPFKRCIEDIASGERNKVVDGIYACTMDAIGIFFTVLGAPAKILTIAARTVSLTSKLASVVKYSLKLTVSTFNPVDGLPTAGYLATKSLLKSGLGLTREGVRLFDKATSQLHRLTGRRQSVDFIQLASLPQTGQGKWRPRADALDVFSVCALNRKDQWYAISSRGTPWGKKLANFQFQHTYSLPSVRSESYTQHIIKNSLPIVRSKIDAAEKVLGYSQLNTKTDLAIGLFLGTTAKGRDDFSILLRAIRLNVYDTSLSNFFLDVAKVDEHTVDVIQSQYSEWKNAGLHERGEIQYLNINSQNLNRRFNDAGFNYGEVADDLLHEMFRAGSGKTDLVAAKARLHNRVPMLDVAPLLNLAAGRLPKSGGGFHSAAEARSNADSLALLTALLSLVETDLAAYFRNMEVLKAAVAGNPDRTITGEVLIELNTD
ncbi:hypothetical protein [Pseudomonas retamae]|uniref:Toxin n=1 Tax=Pseudomonas retamae TaxID=702110 RepID=A0ABW7D5M7_9PSED